jgi:MFS family permease
MVVLAMARGSGDCPAGSADDPRSERPLPSYRSVVTALGIGQLVSWAALYYTFSSFVLVMERDLGWSQTGIMGAFTLGLLVWSLGSFAVGAAIDQGYGRLLMTLGPALGGTGFLVWSQANEPWMFYGAWVLLGSAMAMTLYEPAFAILTRRYPANYRQGITALTLVGGFASTLGIPAAAGLIEAFGWRDALMAIGLVLILLVAPLHAWALRDGNRAREAGMPRGVDTPVQAPLTGYTLSEARQEPTFWLLMGTFTLYSFAAAAFWAHAVPALAAKGLDTAQALGVLIWVGPAQVGGRLLFVAFGRSLSGRTIGVFVLCGLPLAFAIFALTSHMVGLIAFAVLFGSANGLVTIVRGSLVPDYFGRRHVGRIGGSISMVALLARTAAPLVTAGLLLAAGYDGVMLGLAALGAAAVAAFLFARPPAAR